MADGEISDDKALLIRHLVKLVQDRHQVADEKLARLVDVDPAEVGRRLDAETGDTSDLLDVADRVATVDGPVNALELVVISELRDRCGPVGNRVATHEAVGRTKGPRSDY